MYKKFYIRKLITIFIIVWIIYQLCSILFVYFIPKEVTNSEHPKSPNWPFKSILDSEEKELLYSQLDFEIEKLETSTDEFIEKKKFKDLMKGFHLLTYDRESESFDQHLNQTKWFIPSNCFTDACKILKPQFIIIGAQKCGTTSLYKYLLQHEQVVPLSSKYQSYGSKEIRYFEKKNRTHSIEEYMNYFPTFSEIEKTSIRRLVTGEASPNYIYKPDTAKIISKVFPDIKLIALLRDPADRAWSHYQHALKINSKNRYTADLSFSDLIKAELEKILLNCDHFLDQLNWKSFMNCHQFYSKKVGKELNFPKFRNHIYTWLLQMIAHGIYYEQILEYLKYFSPSQILIIQSEEFYDQPINVMKRIERFLGLEPHDWHPESFKIFNFGKGNDIYEGKQYSEEMSAEIRQKLNDYFEPFNEQLRNLFTDGGFKPWPYQKQQSL